MANYTKEEQLELINSGFSGWLNLEKIDNQYEEVCLEAVKIQGAALQYVKEQTYEICLEAVKQNGQALKYVKEKTYEMCLEAVKNYGYALENVEEQTYEICLEAVKNNGWALELVENKTPELCFYAYLNKHQLYNDEYVKKEINKFISNKFIIENKVFCDNIKGKINKDVCYFEKESFAVIRDYILSGNNNEFMLYDASDEKLLKEIALSNNKLTVIDTGNVNDTHKILANEIVEISKLKKNTEYEDIPF